VRRSISLSVALMISGLLTSGAARAHHSFAIFDGNRVVVLKGTTMLSFSYMNPHTWLSVIVPAGTDIAEGRWDIEATSPSALASQGIHGDTFKEGDKLTVGIRPLRDGRHGGSLVFVVDAKGNAYGASPEDFGLKTTDLKP
jgi:hypothetical protein